jgi:hypothetical protein
MKIKDAKALEAEFNEIAAKGRDLWAQIEPMGERCKQILMQLKDANVAFDEIALLFGSELQIEVVGDDEEQA